VRGPPVASRTCKYSSIGRPIAACVADRVGVRDAAEGGAVDGVPQAASAVTHSALPTTTESGCLAENIDCMAPTRGEADQPGAGEIALCARIATVNPVGGGWHAAVS
jgi:hypothetical protein